MAMNEPQTIWLDHPEKVAAPPDRLPRNDGHRGESTALLLRLYKLLSAPGVWHKVAAGGDNKLSPYVTGINSGKGLPGLWEATTRQGILYVRYLGDD